MRTRTVAINIRVTEGEKRRMESAAKKCGISLSAYLRKLGLGKEVQAISPPSFYEAYRELTRLRDSWKTLPDETIDRYFNGVIQKILRLITSWKGKKVSVKRRGSNKNMGGYRQHQPCDSICCQPREDGIFRYKKGTALYWKSRKNGDGKRENNLCNRR